MSKNTRKKTATDKPSAKITQGAKANEHDRKSAVAAAIAKDAAANARAIDTDRVPITQLIKPAKHAKGSKPKAHKTVKLEKPKKTSGLDAAALVLKDAGKPMRCGEMVQKMIDKGLWKTGGKTPAATIYSAILREITTKGSQARFKKTERGLFTLKD